MASPSGPADADDIFDNTDPFQNDLASKKPTDDPEYETLELAGVRTNNPFSSDGAAPDEPAEPEPESAVSPTDGSREMATVGATVDEGSALDAISPGTGLQPGTDPFDRAIRQGSDPASSNAEAPPDLQPTNSNMNGDRAERGTDIFANADPLFPEVTRESSGNSRKDSDSDSARKPAKPHVAFAGHDEIDKAPTRSDSSPDLMDKIKGTLSHAKDKIHVRNVIASGPLKRFNPTSVKMDVNFGDDPNGVGIIWRSRDNRKGRNSVIIPRASMAYPNLPPKNRPVYSSSFKGVGRNLYRMAFTFPYWDMAFWSGWSYTWGSVLFIIDSVWAWIPYQWPNYPLSEGITNYGVGIMFFIGALLYQVGATMAYLEAVNDGSFHGSAMKRFLEGKEDDKKQLLDEKIHNFFGHLHPLHTKRQHDEEAAEEEKQRQVDPEAGWKTIHRRERVGSIYPSGKGPAPRRGGVDLGEAEEGESHEYLTWRWWPTWHALRTHHVYEIGYIACSIQLFGATLYSWCGLVSLPGISDQWKANPTWYGGYWLPETLGSTCFLTASIMFLLETQERWYKPQINIVGWWIGFWAMVGSTGFL